MLKKKDFIHQNIRYSFNWNYKYHKQKFSQLFSNNNDLKKLESFFNLILKSSSFPHNLFNSKSVPRVSQFKIKGIKKAFLMSFSKKLIRAGKIIKFDSNAKLSKHVQNVYDNFKKSQINKKPNHNPVLKNILIKDLNSLAIEVPIWNNSNKNNITGHIDLIQFEDNVIKIIDYKPEGNFLSSLPQVATYGLLVKNKFNIKNLKCISFNKSEVWEYDPGILLTDIKEYLISYGIKTRIWEKFIEQEIK